MFQPTWSYCLKEVCSGPNKNLSKLKKNHTKKNGFMQCLTPHDESNKYKSELQKLTNKLIGNSRSWQETGWSSGKIRNTKRKIKLEIRAKLEEPCGTENLRESRQWKGEKLNLSMEMKKMTKNNSMKGIHTEQKQT